MLWPAGRAAELGMRSETRLTGCDHPNFPPRTTRATLRAYVPHGVRSGVLLKPSRAYSPLGHH